ncbi:MAG TPA: OB-fold nucleic acid binding domain-containing protein, partial [Acidimicrobiales bacterium]|nr:OB-fold nucleic acid binding domain-containing protein [Acidimicrobiales bacterium]
ELPDRRLNRATLELVASELVDGDTEVTVLIPRIQHTRVWHRLLHDRTAGSIAEALAPLPHCNVTIVPYHLHSGAPKRAVDLEARYEVTRARPAASEHAKPADDATIPTAPGSIAIVNAPSHQRVAVTGRLVAVRVQPWGGAQTLEATLRDATGDLTLVFLGRRQIGGIVPGTILTATGVIGVHRNRAAMLNPDYELLSVPNGGSAHH